MKTMKAILMIAITLSLTIALTTFNTKQTHVHDDDEKSLAVPTTTHTTLQGKRVSRFLAEKDKDKDNERNPRGPARCYKDGQKCSASNTYCCSKKCVHRHSLQYDDKNCGKCKNKCKRTQSCCRGKCVYLSYDRRNCGSCGTKCKVFCIYGTCDYA